MLQLSTAAPWLAMVDDIESLLADRERRIAVDELLTLDQVQRVIDHLDMTDRFIARLYRTAKITHADDTPYTDEEREHVASYYDGKSMQEGLRAYIAARSPQAHPKGPLNEP